MKGKPAKEPLNLRIDREIKKTMKLRALGQGITVSGMVEAWARHHLHRVSVAPAGPRREEGGVA